MRNGGPGGIPFGRHRPRIDPTAFVTEGTYVVGRVTVGPRASIWFGAVLRGDFEPIRVGEESLIEDNVVLHGRVVVGRRCVIGHGAILHGCTVADGAVIGANAVVFDRARIGPGALVTAGSVVHPGTRVPPRTIFRNSAGGNHPTIAPVGARTRHWQATSYRKVVATYRAADRGAAIAAGRAGAPGAGAPRARPGRPRPPGAAVPPAAGRAPGPPGSARRRTADAPPGPRGSARRRAARPASRPRRPAARRGGSRPAGGRPLRIPVLATRRTAR